MNRLERLAQGLLKPLNPNLSFLLGALTFFWGLWVLSPFWHVFTSAPVFSKTLDLAPEWAWGAWATVSGLLIMLGIYFHNSLCLTRAAGFATWHWATVSGMLWWGDWQNTAGLTYSFVAIYACAVFLNMRVNFVNQGIKHF